MLREKSRLEAELDRLDTLKNCHASMLDWQEMAQELSGGAEIKEGGDAAEALESLSAEIERLTELLEETETNLLLSSCSPASMTAPMPSSPFTPARAAPRRRIGRRCSSACTCVGLIRTVFP